MKSPIKRVEFDVTNEQHRAAYFHLLNYRKWIMHFELEEPWLELPAMIERKLLNYYYHFEKDKAELRKGFSAAS